MSRPCARWAAASVAALVAGVAVAAAGAGVSQQLQDDLQRLHAAHQGQVQLGARVDQGAASARVRQVAGQLADEHAHLDDQLRAVAGARGVSLEGPTYRDALDRQARAADEALQGRQGADFDQAYARLLVRAHERDLQDLSGWMRDAQGDPGLTSLFQQTQRHLGDHLDLARQLDARLGAAAASAPPPAAGGTASGSPPPPPGGTGAGGEEGLDPLPGDAGPGPANAMPLPGSAGANDPSRGGGAGGR